MRTQSGGALEAGTIAGGTPAAGAAAELFAGAAAGSGDFALMISAEGRDSALL